MPAAVVAFPKQTTTREFALLELARPGASPVPAGVLLIENGSLAFRLRTDWSGVDLEEDDEEYLHELPNDFTTQLAERGAGDFLHELESSASNFLIISDREPAGSASVHELYDRFVDGTVRPFVTHLPLYTLQAAATRFGEDAEVLESGWRRIDGVRLAEGMFVAQVVGRSMEPVIPDGSFCIFRSPVVGSRNGKRLLIEQFGATETSACYTVKRYSSIKVHDGDSWEHASIRLHPLQSRIPGIRSGRRNVPRHRRIRPDPSRLNVPQFRQDLLTWFHANARDLPWRRTRDPYRIWLSETMLQQTRAATAIPYYEQFLQRFPDLESLARASESEVLAAWSGLGYYHRARNLHNSARRMAEAGQFPETHNGILALPGVGSYTAAAVGSIAFNLPHAVLDGNVMRVIARLTADPGDIGSGKNAK